MTISLLLKVLEESKLSPESAAPYLGVSNMTLRRLSARRPQAPLPKKYRAMFRDGILRLVLEDKLDGNAEWLRPVLVAAAEVSFDSVLEQLGVTKLGFADDPHQPSAIPSQGDGQVALILSQIGMSEERRKEVDRNPARLRYFSRLGAEWKHRIGGLTRVIRAKDLTPLDKIVAYGALFYLITPFDLIPDAIPGIGLIDDFGILGFASLYYARRLPELFGPLS